MEISKNKIESIFSRVKGKNILVIGDYMLDVYYFGSVDRISPEAPVPIVHINNTKYLPGGAANVVQNLYSLGANPIPIGVIGNDVNGQNLIRIFKNKKIDVSGIVIDKTRPTTTKTRIVAQNQQIVRVDEEHKEDISDKTETRLLGIINKLCNKTDAVIFEDYNKGLITRRIAEQSIISFKKKNIFVAVDPKQKNFNFYKGSSLIKPNRKEAVEIVKFPLDNRTDVLNACRKILKQYNLESVLITLGEQGMALYEKTGEFSEFPSVARKVYDVTGAGDTVISTLSALIAAGATYKEASFLANQAAGIVVGEIGTATVTLENLKGAL